MADKFQELVNSYYSLIWTVKFSIALNYDDAST